MELVLRSIMLETKMKTLQNNLWNKSGISFTKVIETFTPTEDGLYTYYIAKI